MVCFSSVRGSVQFDLVGGGLGLVRLFGLFFGENDYSFWFQDFRTKSL